MSKVTLYDLPSKDRCACWSLNPWKTRLMLNYKGIEYETKWIEYPDLAPKFKSLGIPPNETGMEYTIPTIRLDDGANGVYVMDSRKIADALEKFAPEPPLHIDPDLVSEVDATLVQFVIPLAPHWAPKIPRNILNEESQEHFLRLRAIRFGMPLDQLEKERGTEERWEEAKPAAEKLAALLRKNGGPFFGGKQVTYADFPLIAFLHMLKRIDPEVHERAISYDPTFKSIYDAAKQWLERDDR